MHEPKYTSVPLAYHLDRKIVKTVKLSPLSAGFFVILQKLKKVFSDQTRTSGWQPYSLSCRQTGRMSGILRRLYLMQVL